MTKFSVSSRCFCSRGTENRDKGQAIGDKGEGERNKADRRKEARKRGGVSDWRTNDCLWISRTSCGPQANGSLQGEKGKLHVTTRCLILIGHVS